MGESSLYSCMLVDLINTFEFLLKEQRIGGEGKEGERRKHLSICSSLEESGCIKEILLRLEVRGLKVENDDDGAVFNSLSVNIVDEA